MKRFGLFILIVFAAASFYISCGDSDSPEGKLKNLKKVVERTAEDVEDEAKKVKKDIKHSAEKAEDAIENAADKLKNID